MSFGADAIRILNNGVEKIKKNKFSINTCIPLTGEDDRDDMYTRNVIDAAMGVIRERFGVAQGYSVHIVDSDKNNDRWVMICEHPKEN